MFGGERKRRNKMVARRGHMVKGRIVHDAEGSGTGWKLAGEQGETEDVEEENDSDRNFKKRCFLEGRPHNRAA